MGCKFGFSVALFISFCDMVFYEILFDFGHINFVCVGLLNFHWFGMFPSLILLSCFDFVIKFIFFSKSLI